jgi:hypothetical protein
LKKGQYVNAGHISKGAKNSGTVFGNNNFAVKAAKGTKFAQKGHHKKGHSTKGFRNTHHKDEFSKNHAFHDDSNVENFFNKFGDEGVFKNDVNGNNFLKGHHADTFHKNHNQDVGHYLNGHQNVANKGINNNYGQKGHNAHDTNFANVVGSNYAHNHGKAINHDNHYGGQTGTGFGKKQGGFGGGGFQGGFGGGHGGGFGGHAGGFGGLGGGGFGY